MDTAELQRHVNGLREIREAANWVGKFTPEIRAATKTHRYERIAHPLDAIIQDLEAELLKRARKRTRVNQPRTYRAPYND
jgi:hypothetical protein